MQKSVGFGMAVLAMILAGCSQRSEETPEQQCSAPETYDNLTQIMSSSASQAASLLGLGDGNPTAATAASKSAIAKIVSYSLPTVDSYDKDTKKVNCSALAKFSSTTAQLLTSKVSLPVNDYGPDHVTYKISYSVQPSADGKQKVFNLESADELASVAFQSSIIAVRAMQGSMQQSTPDQSGANAEVPSASTPDTDNSSDVPVASPNGSSDESINQESGKIDPQ